MGMINNASAGAYTINIFDASLICRRRINSFYIMCVRTERRVCDASTVVDFGAIQTFFVYGQFHAILQRDARLFQRSSKAGAK